MNYELKEGVALIMNFELVKRFERVIIVSRGNVLSMAGVWQKCCRIRREEKLLQSNKDRMTIIVIFHDFNENY